MVALTKEQADKLIEHIKNPDIMRLFLVALKTGFRRSELLGLRWCDADFKHNTLSIQQTVLKIGGQTTISPTTKNFKSRRTIAMDMATMEQLKKTKNRYI
ncbi:MAG: tyrosine-type recombinase/integrase [Acidaminococcaceae bacterium]